MRKKDILRDIEKEMEFITSCMKNVSPDTEAYHNLQSRYDTYVKMRNEMKKPLNIGEGIKYTLDTGIKIAGTIAVPLGLGYLAYNGDKDLKMANQRLWGLIGKRTDK